MRALLLLTFLYTPYASAQEEAPAPVATETITTESDITAEDIPPGENTAAEESTAAGENTTGEEPAGTPPPEVEEYQPNKDPNLALKSARKFKQIRKNARKKINHWYIEHQEKLLGVVGLLLLFLYSGYVKRSQQKPQTRTRIRRSFPKSPDALGKVLLKITREANLEASRGLFLTGAEASQLMKDEEVEQYLTERERDKKLFERAFASLMDRTPIGIKLDTPSMKEEDGSYKLCFKQYDGTITTVDTGVVVQVNDIYRFKIAVE